MHVHGGKELVRAEVRAGDERADRADQNRADRIERAGNAGDILGEQLDHGQAVFLAEGDLHDVGDGIEGRHDDEDGDDLLERAPEGLEVVAEAELQREDAQERADEQQNVDPAVVGQLADEVVPERNLRGSAVGADGVHGDVLGNGEGDGEDEQDEDVRAQRAHEGILRLALNFRRLGIELLGRFDLEDLEADDREDDADEAGAHVGDEAADEVGEDEHQQSADDAAPEAVALDALALEALEAIGEDDEQERHDEDADHVVDAGSGEVQVGVGDAGGDEVRAAGHGGQTGAAEGGAHAVGHQRRDDGHDGIKAQADEEGGGDGGGGAGAGSALHEDGDEQADDDQLDAAVTAGDGGELRLDDVHRAGGLHHVQNEEGEQDQTDDEERGLDAAPGLRPDGAGQFDGAVLHVGEEGVAQQNGEQERKRRDLERREVEADHADEHEQDGHEREEEGDDLDQGAVLLEVGAVNAAQHQGERHYKDEQRDQHKPYVIAGKCGFVKLFCHVFDSLLLQIL